MLLHLDVSSPTVSLSFSLSPAPISASSLSPTGEEVRSMSVQLPADVLPHCHQGHLSQRKLVRLTQLPSPQAGGEEGTPTPGQMGGAVTLLYLC